MEQADVIVLGAGMAGVSVARHLQMRGRKVALVDRQQPGEGTSYGNAGVIEVDGFEPVTFPSDLRSLVRYAFNRETEVHYHLPTLIRLAPWLNELRKQSRPEALARYAEIMKPLILNAGEAHQELAAPAGAEGFYRKTGWIKLFRKPGSEADAEAKIRDADRDGTDCRKLSRQDLLDLEPHLTPDFHTALYFSRTISVSSPGGVTKAFAEHLVKEGGVFRIGDAATLAREESGETWAVKTEAGQISAPDVVIALGPWSMDLLSRFGYRLPLAVKRGYHWHFSAAGNALLSRPIIDIDYGFAITPMEKGIRVTSGIEFADRDASPTPVQLDRLLPFARQLFPLEHPVEAAPWMGARPCMPDSMPVLGPAPRHPGLWFQFGHGHWGFSLGPITGRVVAQMINGETPPCDIGALSAKRFG